MCAARAESRHTNHANFRLTYNFYSGSFEKASKAQIAITSAVGKPITKNKPTVASILTPEKNSRHIVSQNWPAYDQILRDSIISIHLKCHHKPYEFFTKTSDQDVSGRKLNC